MKTSKHVKRIEDEEGVFFLPDPKHPRIRREDGREVFDLRDLTTPAGAAKAFFSCLQIWLQAQMDADVGLGNPDEVWIRTPEDRDLVMDEHTSGWHISWEGGPFEWAMNAAYGRGILSGEGYGECGPKVLWPEKGVLVEIARSFVLDFLPF